MNGVKRAATVDTAKQRRDLADAAAVWRDRHIFIFRLLIQVALLVRPRSGDEGRKEEAAAAAATAARMEIRSRVFCNYPTLLKMIIILLRVWNVFCPQSY